MTTQEIANFIKTQIKLGSTRPEIERILSLNRITPQEISAAFDSALAETGAPSAAAPTPSTPPGLTGISSFPPPAMALNSIDSVTPAYAAPTPPAPAASPVQPPTPPIAPPPTPQPQVVITKAPPAAAPLPPSYFKATPQPVMPPPIPPASTMPMAPLPPKGGGSGTWLMLVIVIIILGLGGTAAYAYFLKPAWATPLLNLIQAPEPAVILTEPEPPAVINVDPTANWQVCLNKKYGFELKYPPDWKIWKPGAPEARLATCEEDLAILSFSPEIYASSSSKLTIDTSDSKKFSSLEEYFSKNPDMLKMASTTRETELGGERMIVLTGRMLVLHNQSLIDIHEYNVDDDLLNQILSTFQFIATSTASTSAPQANNTPLPPPVDLPSLFLPEN